MKFNVGLEYRFCVLWYFIAFVFGVALYFGLPIEPSWILCVVLSGVLFALAFFKKSAWIKILFFFIFGISVATVRTHFIHTDLMWSFQINKEISGRVTQSFSTYKGQVVVLEDLNIEKGHFVPKKIRVSFNQQDPKLSIGDEIVFKGSLFAPHADQAQRFFFQGLSAQGKINELLAHRKALSNFWHKIRTQIMENVRKHLTSEQAEIAIPLIVGEQGVVSPETYSVYRKAGIAHVLSVSGFHMMLLATFVFFLIRGLLALFPYFALRLPTKKIAAIIAFFVTGFYLMISGMQVPAIRSFMMIALVFLGVLTDRKVVSLYTLCLVAFCVLLVRPEWITSVSFQLSFIAVLVLVGVFEDVSHFLPKGLFLRVVVTGVIANILVTLALAPFVVYHFNQFNPYGVVGNLLTSFLFSLLVMPALFVGTVLMPFHGEGLPFKLVGFTLDQTTKLAQMVASWSGSEIILPSFSAWGLALIAFGIVVLCVIKNWMRLIGFVFVVLGIICGYLLQPDPDLIVADKGRTILVHQEDGSWGAIGKPNPWTTKKWMQYKGLSQIEKIQETKIRLNRHWVAFSETACEGADLAILKKKKRICPAKDIFIPKKSKIYEIYLKDSVLIQEEGWRERHRPWSLIFKRKEKYEK